MKKWIKFFGFIAGSGTIAAVIVGGYYGITGYFRNNPGSAEAVIRRYNEAGYDNYRMTYNLTAKSSVTDPDNVTVTTPVSLTSVFDRSEDVFLLDCNLSMDVYTEGENNEENNKQVVVNSSYDSWLDRSKNPYRFLTRNTDDSWSEVEATDSEYAIQVAGFTDLDPSFFKNATLEITDDKFIVTVPVQDIVNSMYLSAVIGDSGLVTSFYEGVFTGEDLRGAFSEGEAVYTFDKKTVQLEKLDINSLPGTYTTDGSENNFTVNMQINMNMNITDYGKISSIDEPVVNSETGNDEDEKQNTEIAETIASDHGQYGDTKITDPTPWNVFGDDGWTADPESEDGYSFVAYSNEKYPDYYLLLFGKGADTVNHSDIERRGAYGYSITYGGDGDPTESSPPFSWKGLTIGCSPEQIVEAFGEPLFHSTDEESGDIEYSYDFDDYSSIDFGFKNNKLCDVIVYVSTW